MKNTLPDWSAIFEGLKVEADIILDIRRKCVVLDWVVQIFEAGSDYC